MYMRPVVTNLTVGRSASLTYPESGRTMSAMGCERRTWLFALEPRYAFFDVRTPRPAAHALHWRAPLGCSCPLSSSMATY